MAGAALCRGVALVTARPSRRGLSPVGSTVTSRNPEAYCQYTETAAVADAVSQVVAAVVAENEGVRRS